LGVNRAVPLLYPKLRKEYGDIMTWEDSRYAHVLTEFGFDTLEVVAGHVAPQKYHDWIGFRVPSPLLQRAFRKTYGLEETEQLFADSLRATVADYGQRVKEARFDPPNINLDKNCSDALVIVRVLILAKEGSAW